MKKGVGSEVGSGSGSISQKYGSGDPDPHQNVTDPQHCCIFTESFDDPHCFIADPGLEGYGTVQRRREMLAFRSCLHGASIVCCFG
jgi:hypothetical protein